MPRPLTDTDIDALLFCSNSETNEENGSNYESSVEDEKDAIADDNSEQTSEEEKDSGPSVQRPNIPSRPTAVTMLTSKSDIEVWHTDRKVNGGR
jgi:hypothetical protein